MKTDYKKQSDIKLAQELSQLTRELQKLKARRQSTTPSTPEQVVELARLDEEINSIQATQVEIGKIMLERDNKRQEKKLKSLEQKSAAGAEIANELLEKLPEFAEQVNVAFTALGNQYAELLTMSKEVRKTNMVLLGANKPQCVPAALRIEPNNLHKILKEQFRSCFGEDSANVFLPQKTHDFDIVEAVKLIQQECTTEQETDRA